MHEFAASKFHFSTSLRLMLAARIALKQSAIEMATATP
jgi:hypothetical protein